MICAAALDSVVIIDIHGKIRSANVEFLRMFGYKRWEMIGKNV